MADLLDPRRLLRDAAERRQALDVMVRGGPSLRGSVVRVEGGGVVVTVAGHRFNEGEDLRLRLTLDGRTYGFEACVLRIGVPVPDRSQDGLMLGYIDRWVEEAATPAAPTAELARVELLPPNGPAVSLLAAPAHLLDLGPRELSFTLPGAYPLVFPTQSRVRLRLGIEGGPQVELMSRVRSLSPGDGAILYSLELCEVDDAVALLSVLGRIEAALWGPPAAPRPPR